MSTGYSVYESFNQNIPSRDIQVADKRKIVESAVNLTKDQVIVFVRLIIEHAMINDDYDIRDPTLPYGGEEVDGEIKFNIKKLPRDLRWILHRFFKMCENF